MKILRILSIFLPIYAYASPSVDFLRELTLLQGPSGFEKPVRDVIKKRWQNSFSNIEIDGMGNVIARSSANQSGPKILLMAHMDEIGYMVESITDNGFLRVIPLGGIVKSVIFAHRWQVITPKGAVNAYSGMDSPHLLTPEERQEIPSDKALFLDIGAKSAKEAQNMGIRVGSPVAPYPAWTPLANSRFLAKALDDRAGLAIITAVTENTKSHPNQVIAAATVQEEIGLRGASTIYESTKPDLVINIEVGIADDYPLLLSKRKNRIALDKGPTLFAYDRSMIPNQELLSWLIELSNQHHVPTQLEVETGYGEDGSRLQISGKGVPVINIGLPMRYAHQEAGIFAEEDYENTVKLVQLIVEKFDNKALELLKR